MTDTAPTKRFQVWISDEMNPNREHMFTSFDNAFHAVTCADRKDRKPWNIHAWVVDTQKPTTRSK